MFGPKVEWNEMNFAFHDNLCAVYKRVSTALQRIFSGVVAAVKEGFGFIKREKVSKFRENLLFSTRFRRKKEIRAFSSIRARSSSSSLLRTRR